ncbi:hypothetical protein [Nostoc sp. NOS(2021)]|uniref:hypothetical protein n=1 Tax=Nostoc sp. NOS(2021) TaxID=2815407 RepID=UPI0025E834E0|nr:hypothetical protein [Nostoc sp. NOS(2021)]
MHSWHKSDHLQNTRSFSTIRLLSTHNLPFFYHHYDRLISLVKVCCDRLNTYTRYLSEVN